jgi:glycosyltransferase involved in cell wall biosynthesis
MVQYYKLSIWFNDVIPYMSYLFDIPEFIPIHLPNVLFIKGSDIRNIVKNDIYIASNNTLELKFDQQIVKNYEIINITKDDFIKKINLYELRKLQDLRLINYYIGLQIFNVSNEFIDRFGAHYSLFQSPDLLDKTFVRNQVTKHKKSNNDKINVLYCMFFSPQYEEIGYTVRTQNLLKSVNDNGVNAIGVSRYGYPMDKKKEYYETIGLLDCDIDGIRYTKLLSGQDNFNTNNIVEYIKKYVRMLVDLINESNIDIIHCATNWYNGLAGYYASQVTGIPCIYEVRGFWDESAISFRPEIAGSDLQKMNIGMERFILNRVDRVLTINDNLKDEINSRCPCLKSSIDIIYNGIDSSKCIINKINKNIIVIGYIGSLLDYEGIGYILRSISMLRDDGYAVKFIMIGQGPEENNLIGLANELNLGQHFDYINKVAHRNVYNYYNVFDIVVYPRRDVQVCRTTSSSKIYEAMCMAKPVIVSRLPAYNEIISDRWNGLYCEPDNLSDIYNKIKELIDDVDLRNSIGKNAREWVMKNREWSGIGQKLVTVYQKMLN